MALYIGLISGTSMDAVDAALVAFDGPRAITVATHSAPIPDDLKHELHSLAQDPSAAALRFWNAECAARGAVRGGRAGAARWCGRRRPRSAGHRKPRPDGVSRAWRAGAVHRAARRSECHCRAHGHHDGCGLPPARRRRRRGGGARSRPPPRLHRAVFSTPGVERGILNVGGIANLSVLPADLAARRRAASTPARENTLLDSLDTQPFRRSDGPRAGRSRGRARWSSRCLPPCSTSRTSAASRRRARDGSCSAGRG